MPGLHFDITGDNSNFLRKLEEAKSGVRNTSKQIEESGVSIEQMFGRLAKGAAAFGAGITAKEIVSNIVRVRGEFQQLEVAFNTMLGSEEKATTLMSQLVKTAATTPFDLQSVAQGAKQLLAYGDNVENVNEDLVRLGNIASGLSQPLNDLVYLYGTTMTQGRLYTQDFNQFTGRGIPMIKELAKQFNVAESEVKGLVEAGKVGFPEVQKVIQSLTNEGGMFSNLMEKQSKTITGQISNIEDSFSTMYNNIGKQSEGFINDALSGVSYLVENYETIGKTILELAAVYGTYKAVLMSVAAYQSMAVGITYAAEITELSKLIPLKQQSANQDIIAAVNSGKLTQAKAEQVIALRAEIAAKIQSLQATKIQAQAEFSSALASYKASRLRYTVAQEQVALAQSQMSIAIKSGTVEEIAAAKKNAQTASLELNNAAVAKNTAHKGVNIAATNSKSASEALNTLETGKNSVAQTVNTASTNILTAAKTKLAAASKALGLSMLANPYVLAAAAVAGLGYAIYKTATAETELDRAHQRLNDATSDVEKGLASEVSKLTSLERKLAETKKGTEEYNNIKKTIVDNYGKYYDGLDGEIERVGSLSTVYGQLVEAMRLSIGQRKFESFFKAEQDNLDKTIGEKLDKAYDTLIEKYGKDKGGKLYQQVFDSVIRGNVMPTDTWKQLNEATFKEWGFDNSPVGFSIRSVSSLISDVTSTTQSSSKALDEFKEKYQITEEEVSKILSGSNTSENKSVENKTLKQLLIDIDASKSKIKKLQEQANKGLISSDKIKEEQDVLSKLTSDYKNRTGLEYGSTKQESAAAKLREQQEKLALLMDKQSREQIRSTEDLWNEVWQAQIDSMDEGSEKALSQMELNHERELQAIDREKEDLLRKKYDEAKALFDADEAIKAQKTSGYKPQSFDGSGVALSSTENTQFDSKYKAALDKQAKERQAYFDAEKQAMNEYLAAYGDYMQKRQAIIEQGEEKKKGKNVWEQKSVDEETKKVLSDLDVEVNKKTSAIGKLFDDMKDRTVKDMRSIADAAEQMLSFINSGTWDESQGIQFGISKETFDTLRKSPQELESIKNEIANVRKEADASETAFNKLGNGLKKVFSAGDDTKKLKEGLEEISQGMNDIMQAGQFLSDSLSQLGDALGSGVLSGIADGINVAMDAMSSTMDGAKAGAMFGPIGAAAGAAIGLVSSLASSFAKIHDAKNEKRIAVLQEQIEVLDKTYDKLGDSVEKAYSKDASKLIAQQNTLLEQQKVLIRNKIAEERDKKRSDDGRIKEWEQQIEDINKLIGENKDKLIDSIFGEDVKSAIDNFAQSCADAWASGEDKAKSAKETVKNMMRQMVTESIKAAIQSSQSMEKIRAKLQAFYADNVLSGWEQDYIYNMAESLQKELDDKFGWADNLMKDDKSTSQNSTKGMSQSMDQDTGNEINGRFTAFQESNEGIRISNEGIKNTMLLVLGNLSALSATSVDNNGILSDMRNLAVMSNSYLEDIARHTKVLLSFSEKLDKIEKNTKGM